MAPSCAVDATNVLSFQHVWGIWDITFYTRKTYSEIASILALLLFYHEEEVICAIALHTFKDKRKWEKKYVTFMHSGLIFESIL